MDEINNYFDTLNQKLENNNNFYENLQNYVINNNYNIEKIVDDLFKKMTNHIDINSDFDEIFIQVYDKDIESHHTPVSMKIIILLYEKLNVLNKLEDDTIYDFLDFLT